MRRASPRVPRCYSGQVRGLKSLSPRYSARPPVTYAPGTGATKNSLAIVFLPEKLQVCRACPGHAWRLALNDLTDLFDNFGVG